MQFSLAALAPHNKLRLWICEVFWVRPQLSFILPSASCVGDAPKESSHLHPQLHEAHCEDKCFLAEASLTTMPIVPWAVAGSLAEFLQWEGRPTRSACWVDEASLAPGCWVFAVLVCSLHNSVEDRRSFCIRGTSEGKPSLLLRVNVGKLGIEHSTTSPFLNLGL